MNIVKMKYLVYCVLVILVSVQNVYAQDEGNDSIRTSYHWTEKWFYQVQGGVNYLFAENTRFVSIDKTLSPSYTFSVGKRFTPYWASRVQFVYGSDKGVYFDHNKNSPLFSFKHYGIIMDASFNIANFIRNNKYVWNERKWNVELKLGLGFLHSGSYELADVPNYQWLNPVPRDNFAVYAGIEFSRKVFRNVDINLELSFNRMNNKYNGQVCKDIKTEVVGDILATAFLGIRYTIPRQKPCKNQIVYVNNYTVPPPSAIAPAGVVPDSVGKQPTYSPKEITAITKELDCYEIDELLQMVKEGKTIRGKRICDIEMVHFDFDKSDIKPEFALYLDKLSTLVLHTDINLLIMGHTDIKGSVEYNYGLSERRSKAVMKYLNGKGVDYNRMVFSYYSKLNPRMENRSDFGRSINRRVEFIILP